MTQTLTDLTDLLRADQIDESTFEAWPMRYELPRVFGGQVAGLAVAIASRTVDRGAEVHSLQCQFLRAGRADESIRFVVRRTRDGRSFANRDVDAYQSDKLIFSARLSFHRPEDGYEHQLPAPVAPGPEGLPSVVDLYHAEPGSWPPFYLEWGPLDIRVVPQDQVAATTTTSGLGSRVQTWMRAIGDLGPEQSPTALYSLVWPTFSSSLPRCCRMESPRPTPVSRWPRWTTACGSIGRSVWMTGCSTITCRRPPVVGSGPVEASSTTGRAGHVASVVQEGLIRRVGPTPTA